MASSVALKKLARVESCDIADNQKCGRLDLGAAGNGCDCLECASQGALLGQRRPLDDSSRTVGGRSGITKLRGDTVQVGYAHVEHNCLARAGQSAPVEGVVRKLTGRKGVDVVFEHVGADTWNGSLLCLKRGGRLVTCGATSGPSATINLMQLFQQQYRITGSFGCRIENIAQSLEKMAGGMKPVIDSVFPLADFEKGLARIEGRQVFGKVVITF